MKIEILCAVCERCASQDAVILRIDGQIIWNPICTHCEPEEDIERIYGRRSENPNID